MQPLATLARTVRACRARFPDSPRAPSSHVLSYNSEHRRRAGRPHTRMKTSAEENRTAPESAALESEAAPPAIDSSAPQNAFEERIATLQTYLEHAPRLDAESRVEYCADAHRIALAALE